MSSVPQKMDLSGVFYIQQQYLADLSAISGNGVTTIDYYTELQNQLHKNYITFADANTSSSYVLDHQKDMNEILTQENERLNQKKVGVDDAITSQRRLIELNESYRKKSVQYINILLVIIIVTILYVLLIIIRRNFPIIPKMVFNLLIAALFAIGILVIISISTKIKKRDEMNFDKLAFVPPPDTSGNIYTSGNTTTSSVGSTYDCVNGNCCTDGTTIWDNATKKCVKQGFTLLSDAYESGNNSISEMQRLPYFPTGFDYYSKL
jgi:hypothetical protein